MFDIGWPELMLIMVIALVVIGPKDLPAAIRAMTSILRKVRGMASEFQSGLDEIAREAGVDEIKRSIDDVVTYDPGEALESIAEMDDGEFSLDEDGNPTSGNSILDPAVQSQMLDDDPDATADAAEEAVAETAEGDISNAANEDEPAPRPVTPATGSS
jgi:sec-independent protein translocase protein TatB